jgi:hypothetical protein
MTAACLATGAACIALGFGIWPLGGYLARRRMAREMQP